jgi:flagellar basal-body rod protein FlgB
MLDSVISNPAIAKLQAAVRFTSHRQEVIANNIANILTPGFRAKDLSVRKFSEALKDASADLGEAMKPVDSPDVGPVKPDGNNVDIDREMAKMSRNALMHNTLILLLNKQYKSIDMALRGSIF